MSRHYLRGFTVETMAKLTYILGEQFDCLQIKLPLGKMSRQPAWSIFLNYEHKIRKEMVKQVMDHGKSLVGAFQQLSWTLSSGSSTS